MTNKPIMIDDVDVAECKDFLESECFAGEKFRWCKDNNNCYYKQLKRKEQELEQYKASKQASYETMQREWNEAKNEVKELKKLLKTRIEDLCDSCGASSMMPMPCKVYEQALQEIKEIAEKMKNMEEECGKCMSYTTIQCKQILQKCEVIDE